MSRKRFSIEQIIKHLREAEVLLSPGRIGRDRMRRDRSSWLCLLVGAIILLVSAALRYLGAQGDLWLDEIWTLNITSEMEHAYLIFWGPYLVNNHFLNTFYIYLVGPESPPVVVRGLAIAAGIASVAVAGLIGLRRGRRDALVNMLLFGLSYAMVHYASEARGYGPMILFILLGFYWLDVEFEAPRKSRRFLFAGAMVLGVLSQPIYVVIIASFGFWFFFERLRSSRNLRRSLDDCVEFFRPTIVLLTALAVSMGFAFVKQGIHFAGIPPTYDGDKPLVFAIRSGHLFLLEFGVPLSVPPSVVSVAVLVIALSAIVLLLRRGDSRALFYLVTVLLVPAVLFVIPSPVPIQIRFFILIGVPVLLLTGQCLAWATRTNLIARVGAGVFLGLFVLGNSMHLSSFLEFGRGNYSAAVQLMEQQATGRPVTVGGPDSFSMFMLVDHYSGRSIHDGEFQLIDQEHWGACAPQWLIIPSYVQDFDPAPTLSIEAPIMSETPEAHAISCSNPENAEQESSNLSYGLKGVYRFWGLSGSHWALYGRS